MSKPIKQFYNRKTGKWHVYYPNPSEGKPAQIIKEVRAQKLPHVPVVGRGKPAEETDFSAVADSLYKQPQSEEEPNDADSKIEALKNDSEATQNETSNAKEADSNKEEESESESEGNGFFNFL